MERPPAGPISSLAGRTPLPPASPSLAMAHQQQPTGSSRSVTAYPDTDTDVFLRTEALVAQQAPRGSDDHAFALSVKRWQLRRAGEWGEAETVRLQPPPPADKAAPNTGRLMFGSESGRQADLSLAAAVAAAAAEIKAEAESEGMAPLQGTTMRRRSVAHNLRKRSRTPTASTTRGRRAVVAEKEKAKRSRTPSATPGRQRAHTLPAGPITASIAAADGADGGADSGGGTKSSDVKARFRRVATRAVVMAAFTAKKKVKEVVLVEKKNPPAASSHFGSHSTVSGMAHLFPTALLHWQDRSRSRAFNSWVEYTHREQLCRQAAHQVIVNRRVRHLRPLFTSWRSAYLSANYKRLHALSECFSKLVYHKDHRRTSRSSKALGSR